MDAKCLCVKNPAIHDDGGRTTVGEHYPFCPAVTPTLKAKYDRLISLLSDRQFWLKGEELIRLDGDFTASDLAVIVQILNGV
jgi:hypothetical protein